MLLSFLLSTWWIILLTTGLLKPFHNFNFLMKFFPEDSLFGEHTCDVQEDKLLIHAVQWQLLKWVYKLVFLFFLEINMPSGNNSKSRKCGASFWNAYIVRCNFESKFCKRFCMRRTSLHLTNMLSTYLA